MSCRCWWTPRMCVCSPRRGSPCLPSSVCTGAPPPTWCPTSTRYGVPWPVPILSLHSPCVPAPCPRTCPHSRATPCVLLSATSVPASQHKLPLLANPPAPMHILPQQKPQKRRAGVFALPIAGRTPRRSCAPAEGLAQVSVLPAGVCPGPPARAGAACAAAAQVLRQPRHAEVLRAPVPARPGLARAQAGGHTRARLPRHH